MENLLDYKKNIFSQNGDDGVIERIFQLIGVQYRTCCEFGAWDGIKFSNCRDLILAGWTAVMIEGDKERFEQLRQNYRDNPRVHCVHRYVDTGENALETLCKATGIEEFDFLSIDIDGLDYNIFQTIDLRPLVICVEVNAGHSPYSTAFIKEETVKGNVGQPLSLFSKIALEKDYELVCYTGNAYYVRKDVLRNRELMGVSVAEAYLKFLDHLDQKAKEWLFFVNLGLVPPYYRFSNRLLSRKNMNISFERTISETWRIGRKIGLQKTGKRIFQTLLWSLNGRQGSLI